MQDQNRDLRRPRGRPRTKSDQTSRATEQGAIISDMHDGHDKVQRAVPDLLQGSSSDSRPFVPRAHSPPFDTRNLPVGSRRTAICHPQAAPRPRDQRTSTAAMELSSHFGRPHPPHSPPARHSSSLVHSPGVLQAPCSASTQALPSRPNPPWMSNSDWPLPQLPWLPSTPAAEPARPASPWPEPAQRDPEDPFHFDWPHW